MMSCKKYRIRLADRSQGDWFSSGLDDRDIETIIPQFARTGKEWDSLFSIAMHLKHANYDRDFEIVEYDVVECKKLIFKEFPNI